MNLEGLEIPTTLVKFYKKGESMPDPVMENHPDGISFTSCQATKQSSVGDVICLSKTNIGCIAAGISLGLIDQNQDTPLDGGRVYTDIMKDQADKEDFSPPTPKDFTQGTVYACHDAGRMDFALFGPDDSGRYQNVKTAKKAVSQMTAIQPANMKAVFFYTPKFDEVEITPDVVVMSVRPVELTRIIQAYQFMTGERVEASMGGLRVVNSDLIARPYLTQEINVSTYCLGARLIAEFGPDRMGLGIPWKKFEIIARGMVASQTGFPFQLYTGADQ